MMLALIYVRYMPQLVLCYPHDVYIAQCNGLLIFQPVATLIDIIRGQQASGALPPDIYNSSAQLQKYTYRLMYL